MSEPSQKHRDAVARKIEYQREENAKELKTIVACEGILLRLPDNVLELCNCSSEWLQISNPTREQVEQILSVLGAGKMEKSVSTSAPTLLNYEGEVDGVGVIIYEAKPPASCRIIEEPEYIPAHNRIKRTIICHE